MFTMGTLNLGFVDNSFSMTEKVTRIDGYVLCVLCVIYFNLVKCIALHANSLMKEK